MPVEGADYVHQLVISNPVDTTDQVASLGAHTRMIKRAVKNTFPNVGGVVSATHTEMNYLAGVTAPIQTQIDALSEGGGGVPAGTIIWRPSCPTGYLPCDGAVYSKTAQASLYSAIGDGYSMTRDTYINGKPYIQQYNFNNIRRDDFASWSTGTSLPEPVLNAQVFVTSSRVYVFGRHWAETNSTPIYVALINPDGTLGDWVLHSMHPGHRESAQTLVTSTRAYLLGGVDNSGSTTAVSVATLNPDGTISWSWSTAGALPGLFRYGQRVVVGNRVYLLCGETTNQIYSAPINPDGTLGTWTTASTTVPTTHGISGTHVTVFAGRVYIFGGSSTGGRLQTVYYATIDDAGNVGSWVTTTSLPEKRARGYCVLSDNRVYIIGGINETSSGVTTVYTALINASDGTISSWTSVSPLPTPLSSGRSIVVNDRVHIISGAHGMHDLDLTSRVYSVPLTRIDAGSWAVSTSLPVARMFGQAIVTNNRVYLLGGSNGNSYVNTVYTAPVNSDGTLGSWSSAAPLPVALGHSQAVITKNRVYLIGGRTNSGVISTVYTAPINPDGTIGAWATAPTSLPGPLGHSQAVVTTNRVFMLGGQASGPSPTNVVYTALIAEDGTIGEWTTAVGTLYNSLQNSQAIVTKDRIYLIGGRVSSSPAFGSTSQWFTAPINPNGLIGAWSDGGSIGLKIENACAIVNSNRVYVLGGSSDSDAASRVIKTTSIHANGNIVAWTDTPTLMPAAIREGHIVITNGKLHIIGGRGRGAYERSYAILTTDFSGGYNNYTDRSYLMKPTATQFNVPYILPTEFDVPGHQSFVACIKT